MVVYIVGHTIVDQWVGHKQCSASSILLSSILCTKQFLYYSHLFSQPHGNGLLTLMEVVEGHCTSIYNVMAFGCTQGCVVRGCSAHPWVASLSPLSLWDIRY